MTQFANITINDGQATPVAHVFSTKSNDQRMTIWEDRALGVPVAYPKIIMKTTDTSVIRKVDIGFSVPTLEAVSGANTNGFTPPSTVAYTHRADVTLKLPQRGTLQERKNLYAYLKNALALALFAGVVQDGEEISG